MNEINTINQPQNSEPIKISKWAKVASILVLTGYFSTIVLWILIVPLITDVPFRLFSLNRMLLVISIILIIPGLISGIIAHFSIALSEGKLKGTGKANGAFFWSIAYLLFAYIIMIPLIAREQIILCRETCGYRLSDLGKALQVYAQKNGSYPTANKWCDILLEEGYATKDKFRCPGNRKAKGSYSMNPNCEPNSPPDTVLLFESKGGWNSFGGPEFFTNKHHENEGGNILYNDGYVCIERLDSNNHLPSEIHWGQK